MFSIFVIRRINIFNVSKVSSSITYSSPPHLQFLREKTNINISYFSLLLKKKLYGKKKHKSYKLLFPLKNSSISYNLLNTK